MKKYNLLLSTIGFLVLQVGFAWAAIAPLSPKALKEIASHIVTGEVLEITSMIPKSKTERAFGIHRDHRVFKIKVKVTGIGKGSGIKLTDKIIIRAWKPSVRIPPHPGSQGHDRIPRKGDKITAYLYDKKDNDYSAVMPNGLVIGNK
tara:strand:- start:223 stop:663 length:441 start_codon:yes stop_codon:yes gene_type:complete